MRHFLIIPLVFASLSMRGQFAIKENIEKSIPTDVNELQFRMPLANNQFTFQGDLDGDHSLKPCKTFNSYGDGHQQNFTMKREALPGELMPPLPFSDADEAEGQVSIYSTNAVQMGKFKFSCDYIFDDEGRLIDCEPMWQFGK